MPIMESTTLITFMLHHPSARSVELLGSWDGFAEAYVMKRDSRRGPGHWTGCHTFRDIICDGETSLHEKRNGGLKMGGTYWYFYRIDNDEEFFDPTQHSENTCPLMPGQLLNVLDVPQDTERFISRSRSSSISVSSCVKTLNPDDRYATPRPAPKPKLPRLVTSAGDVDATTRSTKDRPWSAVDLSSRWSIRSRSNERGVRSATGSPSVAIKSAFMHLKGPASALTPSEGGRGRSRILHGDHKRTKSPGTRELKRCISRPRAMPSQLDRFLESENSPMEESSAQPPPLFVQKRSHSPNLLVRRLQERAMPEALHEIDTLPDRGRSVSHNESRGPGPIRHRRGFSDNFANRRSTSLRRKREPSPLRNVMTTQAQNQTIDWLQIPTGIPEVDAEDVVSPRKAPDAEVAIPNRPRSEPPTPSIDRMMIAREEAQCSPHYEKDLPTLPSYLMPEPLFVRSESRDMGKALRVLNEQYSPPTQCSPWGAAFGIPLPESPETDREGSDSHSPTFSSIKGGTSGVCTPHRLSELPDWPLRSNLPTTNFDDVQLRSSLENLSIHARTASTNSTVPYSLSPGFDSHPFHDGKLDSQDHGSRKMTQMEQLIDEFDYLGAALI